MYGRIFFTETVTHDYLAAKAGGAGAEGATDGAGGGVGGGVKLKAAPEARLIVDIIESKSSALYQTSIFTWGL